jgi:streptogramin lyase
MLTSLHTLSSRHRVLLALVVATALAALLSGCSFSAASGTGHFMPTQTPAGLRITEFPLARVDFVPDSPVIGSDGNIWFAEVSASGPNGKIGRMTPAGAVTEFPLPTTGAYPTALIAAPDGNLWFTEPAAIGRITLTGAVTEYPVNGLLMPGLALGRDQVLWFAEMSPGDPTREAGKLGRISLTGAVSETPLAAGVSPTAVAAGPDGAMWFAEASLVGGVSGLAPKLGRVGPSGAITEFSLPATAGQIRYMTTGPDGNLWFTEDANNPSDKQASGKLGRMTPTGTVTEFPLPAGNPFVNCITPGRDNTLWLCGRGLLRVTLDGTFSAIALPTLGNMVTGIAPTAQGIVWFAEASANGPDASGAHGKIGRLG